MLQEHSSHQEQRVRSSERKRIVSAPYNPRLNRVLAALAPADYERLLPGLDPVPLPRGWIMHGVDERQKTLYFPTAGLVSRFYVTQEGASVEISATGNEGVIGVTTCLGGGSSPSLAMVQSAGYAYRLKENLLKKEFERGGQLRHLLLRYIMALMAQSGQIAACNRRHSIEQRLCRWLLSSLDRLSANELFMTQESLANTLGVRREGVTEVAGRLQAAGLFHYNRGHIGALDRPGLEQRACECYAMVKGEYDRLLPQVSTSRHPAGPGSIRRRT